MTLRESISPNLKACKKLGKKNYQYIAELKQELSTPKKFLEYFFIIGLDPKMSIEEYLYNSSLEDLNNFYLKSLKPEIITKFPPINKSYINIDDNLTELCFPDGFKLEKYGFQPQPEPFKFLLGNYFYSIEHPLKYVTCLKFYENLEKYKKIHIKLKKYLRRASMNLKNSTKTVFMYESLNEESNTRKSAGGTKGPNVCLTKDDKEVIKESEFNKYYFPKIIGFVSLEPFYDAQKKILFQIYNYYKNEIKLKTPLEKIVLNVLFSIPMPSKGLNVYYYKLNDNSEQIEIKAEKMNKLKNIDDDLEVIFKYFTIDNFLEIFKYVLYETKTIIFGTNINHLYSFVYSLISILYPLTYPFQVSSSIHKNAFEVLESISPYIIGVNQKYNESFFSDNKIEIKGSNYIVIDLENKEYIQNISDEVPNIPKNLYKKLKTKMTNNLKKRITQKIDNQSKNGGKNKNEEETEENWICYVFFDFFLNVLYNYGDYLNNDNLKKNYKISSLKILFNVKQFIDSHSSNERAFYKKFLETQMFNDFIFKKMIPKDVDDKLEILFFDEYLNKKNNKKLFSKNKSVLFLNSKEYEYKEKFQIPIINGLTMREKKRYKDKNYLLNSLLLAQEFTFEKTNNHKEESNINNKEENKGDNSKENKDNNNIIIVNEENKEEEENSEEYYINYLLFPKFNKDFFNDPSHEYSSFSPMSIDIRRINTDLLAKSHISPGEMTEGDEGMLDYIYLTYIEVWGFSYWYQDIIERDYRFEQMLNILDKIKHHEIELINVLFESLNKFQEKEKIIRLYDKILAYNITPNSFIYSIVGKIVQKKQESQEFIMELKSDDKSKFPRRTFRGEDETNILGDSISFNYFQKCPDCNKLIDIENISKDYKKMKKEILWAKCPFCNYIKPEVTVNFGNSISSKYSTFNCSKVETFTLYSPYELKNSLKDVIEKEKFHLLDIDKFKMKFPNLFWSCIWYFHLYNLDFNIMLPYEVNIFKSKTNYNGINMHLLNSKIAPKVKKNYEQITEKNNIIINKAKNNNNKNTFIMQNVNSFSYIKNIYFDYFGIFKKVDKNETNNYRSSLSERKKTFIKGIKISQFLNSKEETKLSDKNLKKYNFFGSPSTAVKIQKNIKFEINELDEIKLENQNKDSITSNLREINEIKPFKFSKRKKDFGKDDSKDGNSSSSSDKNSFDK